MEKLREYDPYIRNIDRAADILKDKKNKERDRVKAVKDLYWLSWNGGQPSQDHVGKSNVLEILTHVLDHPDEPFELKNAVLKSLSIVVRGHKANQDSLRKLGCLEVLTDYLLHSDEEMRKWAAHALFFILARNSGNQSFVVKLPNFKARLFSVAQAKSASWVYSDALEVISMLGWGEEENESDEENSSVEQLDEQGELYAGL